MNQAHIVDQDPRVLRAVARRQVVSRNPDKPGIGLSGGRTGSQFGSHPRKYTAGDRMLAAGAVLVERRAWPVVDGCP